MLVIRDVFVKRWTVRLDELGLTYKELRGAESVIIVYLQDEDEIKAFNGFLPDFMAFEERLRVSDLEKSRKKLARKNRFRRLTFRAPLPAPAYKPL